MNVMVDVVNLTESRITLERTSEHAYDRDIMIMLTEVGRSTTVGGTISQLEA